MSDIRKRMAHVKAALLHEPCVYLKSDRRRMEELYKEHGFDTRLLDEFYKAADAGTKVSDEHYGALERAKEYFAVDDDRHAALAMAMVLFPPSAPAGAGKGHKDVDISEVPAPCRSLHRT
jgi:hypothetical protein